MIQNPRRNSISQRVNDRRKRRREQEEFLMEGDEDPELVHILNEEEENGP